MKISEYSLNNDRTFCINLSACFLTKICKDKFMKIIPFVDILFGNEEVKFCFNIYDKFSRLFMRLYFKGSAFICC
jgi:hypothetical protein